MSEIAIEDTGFIDLKLAVEGGRTVVGRVDLIHFYNKLYEAGKDAKGGDLAPSVADEQRAEYLHRNNFPGVSKTVAHLLLLKLSDAVVALKKDDPSAGSAAQAGSTGSPSGPTAAEGQGSPQDF